MTCWSCSFCFRSNYIISLDTVGWQLIKRARTSSNFFCFLFLSSKSACCFFCNSLISKASILSKSISRSAKSKESESESLSSSYSSCLLFVTPRMLVTVRCSYASNTYLACLVLSQVRLTFNVNIEIDIFSILCNVLGSIRSDGGAILFG